MNALAIIIIILSSLCPISDYFLFYSISLMDNIFPLLVILFSILTIALKSKTVYSVFASVFALLFYMTNAGWNVFSTFISFLVMLLSFFMAICAETTVVSSRKEAIWKIRKESELAREKKAADTQNEKTEEKPNSASREEKKAYTDVVSAGKKRKEIIRWPRVLFIISALAVACVYLYLIIDGFTFRGLVDWFYYAINTGNIYASAFISAFLPVALIALCFIRKRSVCVISSVLVFFLSAWAILQFYIYSFRFNFDALFFTVFDVFSFAFYYINSIILSFNDYPMYYVTLFSPLLLVITSIIYAKSKKVYVAEKIEQPVSAEKSNVQSDLNTVSSVSDNIDEGEKKQDKGESSEDEILDVEQQQRD